MHIEYKKHCQISEMEGKTISAIIDLSVGSECAVFQCDDGSEYTMFHCQDCCESVAINDIEGDICDLIGLPLIVCEAAIDIPDPEGQETEYADSFTWTFYRLATAKGFVVIRWYGESNGYYSESVEFAKTR